MKRRLFEKHADSGSALILVLLITALLATIAVSFLSTSRVEMIAAKNFSRQNAATGLAEMATQQAMGKIQQGFTITGNATTIITTQPGAITQFAFTNGNIISPTPVITNNAITYPPTASLFSGTGNVSTNGTANLNNLQNPGNVTANATANQFTITGNRAERILVPMENITSNGTVIGRVAYYVDDEGTKLNANSATGDRTTLNAANRPQDITALVSSAGSSFSSIIGSTSSNTSSIKGWSHFFRPEQVAAAVDDISGNHMPFISTATPSASTTANMSHLLTPWGTQRLYINELPITTASVNRTFTAFTANSASGSNATDLANGQALNNVFGGNFSAKYTPVGVKQIAANIFQMRDPNTNTINASFSYNGSLLGSQNANATNQIPNEYLGYAPYPVITEVGVSIQVGSLFVDRDYWGYMILLHFCPTIEITNPYPFDYKQTYGGQLKFDTVVGGRGFIIDEVSFDIDHGGGNTQRYTWSSAGGNSTTIRAPLGWAWSPEQYGNPDGTTGGFPIPDIPAFSKIQFQPDWNHWWSAGLPITCGSVASLGRNLTAPINNISNCTVTIRDVKIIAGGNIRDWVTGVETGPLNCQVTPRIAFPWTTSNWPFKTDPTTYQIGSLPDSSSHRIDWIRKTPMNATINLTSNDDRRNWTTTNSSGRGGGASGNASTGFPAGNWTESTSTWINPTLNDKIRPADIALTANATESAQYNSTKAKPSLSKDASIPSDPAFNDSPANAVFPGNNTADMREPFLITGNYTCPSDLGLVPTNQRWRRLRMQMQPSAEGSMIPDWAMLEVISFGNSTDANSAFNRTLPVNINGRFYLPGNVTNTTPPAPRTIGVKALAQVLSLNGTGSIQSLMNATASNSTDATRFKGNTANATTIANAIGNMAWSSNSTWGQGNSTNDPGSRRRTRNFPVNQYILPSEIMEIAGVADAVDQTDYSNSNSHFKWNEGRASALIPAITTRSSFFTIYAYAQALDSQQNIESEALTKTLVEVQYDSSTTPPSYKVKKLYTQPIPLGQ